MSQRRQRTGARAAAVARDQYHIGVRLCHARRHGAHANLRDELHGDARFGIHILQVVDQLRQIFNRVDIVMRRRRHQAYAWRGVPHPRDLLVDLVARQLTAFAGLSALRDLDLQFVGVDQIVGRHAKAAGGHLLDGAASQIAVGVAQETLLILAALAGVRSPAHAVHRDRHRLVRLFRDGAVAHRAGGEALHDLTGRLHFLNCDGRVGPLEFHQSAQRAELLVLVVDVVGELFVVVEIVGRDGVLELGNGGGIDQMILAAHTVLEVTAGVELRVGVGNLGQREGMLAACFFSDHIQADALDA